MPISKTRFTMRQLMLVVAASALGLAIRPTVTPWLALLTPVAWMVAPLRNPAIITLAVVLLGLCGFVEIELGEPVTAAIYLPIALVISGAIGLKRPILQNRDRLVALIVANALILALFFVPWTTRKPFLCQLYSIKPGMSAAEAVRIMDGVVVDRDVKPEWLLFRHSIDDPRFNADVGFVTIQNGKVVEVRFDPD